MTQKRCVVFSLILVLLFLSSLLVGCRGETPFPVPAIPTATIAPDVFPPVPPSPDPVINTPTPPAPSPTPEAVAFRVNEEAILLDEFNSEMALFMDAGIDTGEQAQDIVIDEMINQVLLAQAAYKEGFWLDEAGLLQRFENLAHQAGGHEVLNEWMERYGYSQSTFEKVLARAAAAAWMRDTIIATVPGKVEHVRVRQLFFSTEEDANQTLSQLKAGTSFASLAQRQDPVLGGDLGWFPRGYLQESAIEEAAFNLHEGEFSEVIPTSFGYHILLLVERDPQRSLEHEARLTLQEKVLLSWLDEQKSQSSIELSLP
jgi:peptidyl-prolyl cis-trans isomerase C